MACFIHTVLGEDTANDMLRRSAGSILSFETLFELVLISHSYPKRLLTSTFILYISYLRPSLEILKLEFENKSQPYNINMPGKIIDRYDHVPVTKEDCGRILPVFPRLTLTAIQWTGLS